ncbi:hypothetical protein BJY52DRAFT_1232458 [Lactarius psammicola]|nr:hypothetical protein BJY52DRAFT_1232458 [Lactarius psammicola]
MRTIATKTHQLVVHLNSRLSDFQDVGNVSPEETEAIGMNWTTQTYYLMPLRQGSGTKRMTANQPSRSSEYRFHVAHRSSLAAIRIIPKTCLQVLEARLPHYAGVLGDNAVERYTLFLTSIALAADPSERRTALQRAREHGLDVPRVAIVTEGHAIETRARWTAARSRSGRHRSPILRVQSIKWTVVENELYKTTLQQANVILKYLLYRGKVDVANLLLDTLPAGLAVISTPEQRVAEYLDYRQLSIEWTRDGDTRQYVPSVTTHVNTAQGLAHKWQLFVPELKPRPHKLLVSSRTHISDNVRRALFSANVIADPRSKEYLAAIRGAVLAGFENGGSDSFSAVL